MTLSVSNPAYSNSARMKRVISSAWLEKRAPHWERLQELLHTAGASGLKQLSREQLQELALLYRQLAADLSTLRTDPSAKSYTLHVNGLLARAHHIIYSTRKTNLRALLRFFTSEYPRIFREQFGFVAFSLFWVVASGIVALAVTVRHPQFAYRFLGPEMIATMERHEMWTHSVVTMAPQATSMIMTNNLTVSFGAFAMGLTFGLGTLWSMGLNGVMLGVVGVACYQHDMSVDLWSFVAPHGSLELPAIVIAGAAGFRLAWGMLFPGSLRWKESVAIGGRQATRLITGVIPMLVVAACLEGFFSPSAAPVPLKFAVGGVLFTGLVAWLSLGGRRVVEAEAEGPVVAEALGVEVH